jgi:hypothetical protein
MVYTVRHSSMPRRPLQGKQPGAKGADGLVLIVADALHWRTCNLHKHINTETVDPVT